MEVGGFAPMSGGGFVVVVNGFAVNSVEALMDL